MVQEAREERPDEKIRIGKIVGCHGVRGDVKIRPVSEEAAWVKSLRRVFLRQADDGRETALEIQSSRVQGPLVIARFAGMDNRNFAEPLVGAVVYAMRQDLPAPGEDEFWADDLIGLAVVDARTGRKRGVVKDLLSSAGADFLEIQIEDASETVVVPFVEHFFPSVDLEARTVSIDLLSDFLEAASGPVTDDRLEQ